MKDLNFFTENYTDVIKVLNPLNKKQPLFDGIFRWNDKYWEEVTPLNYEAFCLNIFERNDVNKESEQRRIIKQLIASISVNETNKDSEYLFCMKDGVVDIREIYKLKEQNTDIDLSICKNKWLFSHDKYKKNYITMFSNVTYIFQKKRKLEFFIDLLQKDLLRANEVTGWLLDFMSSLLVHDNKCQQFVEFFGKKRTGKTTIVNFLTSIMGSYANQLPEGLLTNKQSDSAKELFLKRNYRLLTYSEPNDKPIKSALLKRITGNSAINENDINFHIKSKIIIDSNFLLKTDNTNDEAFKERRVIIPFCNPLTEDQRDLDLEQKLITFKDDVFSEMIDRVFHYANVKVSKTSVSKEIEAREKLLQNPINDFYNTCCIKTNADIDIESKHLHHFFDVYYSQRFIEFLKIDGKCLFEEEDIKKAINMKQNKFNGEILSIHKNTVRTNNCLILKHLDVKLEKQYWGDDLEMLRNNDVVIGFENVKHELIIAEGRIRTFDKPIDLVKKLHDEITQNNDNSRFREYMNLKMMMDWMNNGNKTQDNKNPREINFDGFKFSIE